MAKDTKTRDTIVRLLSNMGSQKEVHQYLKRFSQVDSSQFAVVKVGGAILEKELKELASALAFLQRVGLTPIVIHGAGPQLSAELEKQGIEPKFIDGLRVTDGKTLGIARKVMQKVNLDLVEALQKLDIRATSITEGVFEANLMNRENLGLVGEVRGINLDSVRAALKVHSIPVLTCLGVTEEGQIVNINADMAANELVRQVKPYKIVFLTGTGGLLDNNGEIISSVNLSSDYDELVSQDWVNGGMELKLKQIRELLLDLPLSSSVSITRPAHLTKELFTHRGAGTLVRLGEKILDFDSWEGVDLAKLRSLVDSAFGRPLNKDYFEKTELYKLYVTEGYRAAAIITREKGFDHLDKFAVNDEARGEGLGRAVWLHMKARHPELIWRSRRHNVVNTFYFDECEGAYKKGDWVVFWYGVQDLEKANTFASYLAGKKATI